ncbi:hypothetical protein GCM10010409_54930 [Mycolicibacterium diernhoferi]
MRTVTVHLDPGLGVRLRVGVTSYMGAPVDDEHSLAEFVGHAFSDRQAEESGADDEKIHVIWFSGHRQQGYPTGTCGPEMCELPGTALRLGAGDGRSQLAHDSASSL